MDYQKTYIECFQDNNYSNDHHIQYDWIIQKIKNYKNLNRLVDIGSGRGQLIKLLKTKFPESKITSLDLQNFHNIEDIEFIQSDLSRKQDREINKNRKFDILTCLDVFEHLDKNFINDVIEMCSNMSDYCLFSIANHSDKHHGVELHTIQENDLWWEKILTPFFQIKTKEIKYSGRLYLYECIKL